MVTLLLLLATLSPAQGQSSDQSGSSSFDSQSHETTKPPESTKPPETTTTKQETTTMQTTKPPVTTTTKPPETTTTKPPATTTTKPPETTTTKQATTKPPETTKQETTKPPETTQPQTTTPETTTPETTKPQTTQPETTTTQPQSTKPETTTPSPTTHCPPCRCPGRPLPPAGGWSKCKNPALGKCHPVCQPSKSDPCQCQWSMSCEPENTCPVKHNKCDSSCGGKSQPSSWGPAGTCCAGDRNKQPGGQCSWSASDCSCKWEPSCPPVKPNCWNKPSRAEDCCGYMSSCMNVRAPGYCDMTGTWLQNGLCGCPFGSSGADWASRMKMCVAEQIHNCISGSSSCVLCNVSTTAPANSTYATTTPAGTSSTTPAGTTTTTTTPAGTTTTTTTTTTPAATTTTTAPATTTPATTTPAPTSSTTTPASTSTTTPAGTNSTDNTTTPAGYTAQAGCGSSGYLSSCDQARGAIASIYAYCSQLHPACDMSAQDRANMMNYAAGSSNSQDVWDARSMLNSCGKRFYCEVRMDMSQPGYVAMQQSYSMRQKTAELLGTDASRCSIYSASQDQQQQPLQQQQSSYSYVIGVHGDASYDASSACDQLQWGDRGNQIAQAGGCSASNVNSCSGMCSFGGSSSNSGSSGGYSSGSGSNSGQDGSNQGGSSGNSYPQAQAQSNAAAGVVAPLFVVLSALLAILVL
jgi:hypothetical protein